MNATGLILVSLPDPYWLMLHDRLVSTVEIGLQTWSHNCSPLTLFNFKATFNGLLFNEYANLLAITHAVSVWVITKLQLLCYFNLKLFMFRCGTI